MYAVCFCLLKYDKCLQNRQDKQDPFKSLKLIFSENPNRQVGIPTQTVLKLCDTTACDCCDGPPLYFSIRFYVCRYKPIIDPPTHHLAAILSTLRSYELLTRCVSRVVKTLETLSTLSPPYCQGLKLVLQKQLGLEVSQLLCLS